MRIYDTSQEGLLFLSPYVEVHILPDRLQMIQTLYSCETSLFCTKSNAEHLLRLLADGISEENLYSVLENDMICKETEKLIKLWMQMGVIE